MDNVAQHHKGQRVLKRSSRKQKHISNAQYHAGDRVCDQGNTVDGAFITVRQCAPGCDQGCAVRQQRSEQGGAGCHGDGMGIGIQQLMIQKCIPDVVQGKAGFIGPFFYHGDHKDHRENGQYQNGQDRTGGSPADIPGWIFFQVDIGNAVIPDIESFKDVEDTDASDGWNEHDDRHNSSPAEIGDAADHFVIKDGSDHVIAAAHRGGNAKISKAQKKSLDKGSGQCTQQRADHCDPEG